MSHTVLPQSGDLCVCGHLMSFSVVLAFFSKTGLSLNLKLAGWLDWLASKLSLGILLAAVQC